MGKYRDTCVFELFPEKAHWGDWCAKPQAYFRGESSMPGANYHVGFQTFTKSVVIEDAHFHMAADEYLVFLGASVPDVFDFDATIELDIGEDPDNMETMIIDKASVIKIPPYMWHGPIRFNNRKPVVFQAAYFDGTWSKISRRIKADGTYGYIYEGDNVRMCKERPSEKCTLCGKCFDKLNESGYKEADYKFRYHSTNEGNFQSDKGDRVKGKYDYLKYKLPEMVTYWGDWCAKPQAYMHGDHDFPGSHYHIGFQVFTKSNQMELPHFHHHADEYLVFVGANFPNVFDFDATITLFMGEDPDNMEKVVVDKPCVIRIPPNVWHCPIYFDLRKPVMFQATFLDGIWHKVLRRQKENGEYEYYYEGDNIRHCRLEPDKWCNICGKCFAGLNETSFSEGVSQPKPDWAE